MIEKHYFALFLLLITGVNGAFITGDLFNLYVWFEVMLLSSFVLITMGGTKEQFEGGVKYLIINLFSSILFLGGVGLIYGKLGTLNMAEIALLITESEDAVLINSQRDVVASGIWSEGRDVSILFLVTGLLSYTKGCHLGFVCRPADQGWCLCIDSHLYFAFP